MENYQLRRLPMTLSIELKPEVENRLILESLRVGVPKEELIRDMIEAALPAPEERNRRAIQLLRLWRENGDVTEQTETLESLKSGLNLSHSSSRNIFP